MPLIILSGLPSSGKTYRAQQLHDYFQTRLSYLPPSSSTPPRIHLISDHSLAISRNVYNLESKDAHERSNNASEKDARATIYGAVKRVLSNKDIVILDGANYIKGWRYQLYCEAKAVRSTHCIVHIGTPVDKARELNEERLATQESDAGADVKEADKPYDRACWENLVFRYEEPNAFTRWDSPLFTVLWEDETPQCDAIWEALIGSDGGKKVVKPNAATVMKAASSEDYLYELDRSTQTILNQILEWSKDHPGEGGGLLDFGERMELELPSNPVGLPALQRLRRQFISLNRQNSVPVKRIRESFIAYLNQSFEAM
ncbi:RNA polymerase II elongator complex subunit [Phlyctema vagabunda]|uniref:RNA polymerase II elongator complex subunit n=1 Tax=Phlyctema vagabunda TaxID=108571 RepID=A0ABR4PY97_9HELO